MSAFVLIVVQPFIQIGLQRVETVLEVLTERDLIELL